MLGSSLYFSMLILAFSSSTDDCEPHRAADLFSTPVNNQCLEAVANVLFFLSFSSPSKIFIFLPFLNSTIFWIHFFFFLPSETWFIIVDSLEGKQTVPTVLWFKPPPRTTRHTRNTQTHTQTSTLLPSLLIIPLQK